MCSYAYENIDMCNLCYGKNLIALIFIRRAHLTINSLAVGFSYRYLEDFDVNRMYYGRLLEPLQYLGYAFLFLCNICSCVYIHNLYYCFTHCPIAYLFASRGV